MKLKDYRLIIISYNSNIKILFAEKNLLLQEIEISTNTSSRSLIPSIKDLLKAYDISLKDLTGIWADHGPLAFTTLRTIVVTINGLAFSSGIKLFPISSLMLEAIIQSKNMSEEVSAVMLNAYSKQVFVTAVSKDGRVVINPQCLNLDKAVTELNSLQKSIKLAGSGSLVYKNEIKTLLNDNIEINEIIHLNGLDIVSELYDKTDLSKSCLELTPQYIKPGFLSKS